MNLVYFVDFLRTFSLYELSSIPMDITLRNQLADLMKREVVVATGCTEPGAVALCVTKARETLGCMPDSVELRLSKNVFKNAMGVGIPGTGMIGLPIAVAMALCGGDSSKGLQVLSQDTAQVQEAKKWLANHTTSIKIGVENSSEKLYIKCICFHGDDQAKAVIARQHSHFVYIARNNDVQLDITKECKADTAAEAVCEPRLTAQMVYDFATTAPIEELQFIRETVRLNKAASDEGLRGYGLNAGRILMEDAGDDIVHQVVARTVAASDARMDGCTLPIYSNSGSGNQGITCTLPVYEYGTLKHCSDEQITRALILSHLMSIYIKRGIGRLSALCGIVNASMGVASGLTYLRGGDLQQISFAIKNMINTITGMVCDGAKPSCALKIATGLYTAFVSSRLAVNGYTVNPTDGISETDVDRSISSLCRLGHDGMDETDDMILDIMTNKKN